MVAIVTGSTLGLNLGSLASIGPGGQFGNAALGQSGERTYVDVSTGNLVVQDVDATLIGLGGGAATLRTYNSQGVFDQDNGDGWRGAPYRSVVQHGQDPVIRTDIDGSQTSFVWDASRNAFVAQAAAGRALDTIVQRSDGNWEFTDGSTGRKEVYQGFGQGLILSSTDPSGNTWTYAYGSHDLLQSVTNSDGEVVNYTYDPVHVGNLTNVGTTLKDGTVVNEVSYEYDALNRLAKVHVALDASGAASYTTQYDYDGSSNRVSAITQDDGTRLSFTYVNVPSGTWRIATVTDGADKTTAFNYDVNGAATTVTDPLGASTVYKYDSEGQLLSVRMGVTPSNAAGLSQTAYTYDGRGDVTSVTDGLGHSVTFSYDQNANQTGQVDALGNELKRTFDAKNQLVTETVFPQADAPLTTRYVYDGAGHNLLRFAISAQGRVTEYRYDNQGLRTAAIVYTGGGYPVDGLAIDAAPTEAQLQAWVAVQDASQTQRTDFGYDWRGQLQASTTYSQIDAQGAGVASTAQTVRYVYDPKGQLLQTVSADGAATTQRVYDGLGRQVASTSAATDGSASITTLTLYDDAHGRATVRLANGLNTVSVYDHAGRLVSVSQDAGGPSLGTTRYTCDADGNVTMTEDASGERSWMLYDAAGRKVADIAADGQLTEYVYDHANRLAQTIAYAQKVDVAALGDGSGVTLASLRQPSAQDQKSWNFYDAGNRLCFQVDALGHVTQTQYDGASRVTSVTRLAHAVDVATLGDGVEIEMLVDGRGTTTQLSETLQPGGPNAPRILTAQVSGQGTAPTGLVSFYVQDTLLGTATLVNGTATLVVSNLPPGADLITAVYAGDGDNLGSTSDPVIDNVAPAYAATTTLIASTSSAQAGASVRLSATVAGLGPAGLVIFYSGTRAIGIASLADGVATLDVNNLAPGNNTLTAVYQGDAQNAKSASAAVTEVITQASSATAETITTLLASDARSLPGQPVTLTAQVSGATPSGRVDFYNGAQLLGSATLADGLASLVVANLPTGVDQLTARYAGDASNTASASTPLGVVVLQASTVGLSAASSAELGAPLALSANVTGASPGGVVSFYSGSILLGSAAVSAGVAQLTVSTLPLGPASIRAVYSGDGANVSSTSGAAAVTIGAAHTTTTLAASASTVAASASLTLTANVAGTGQPSGPVNFYNNGVLLGTANVVNGVATLAVNTLPVGTARLSASFTGSTGNTASTSATSSVTVTTADATQTTLAASATAVTLGSSVTLTASIAGAGTPGGTITFYRGATALGTAAVSAGQATLVVSGLPVGTSNVTAVYSGDAAHSTSSAGAVAVTVSPATTQLTLASSAPSSACGTPVTLTASVAGGFNAGGTITFFNGQTALGTATLVNGQAGLTIDSLPPGTLALQASYSGDTSNVTSVATFSQTVTPAPTTVTLSTSPSSARQGAAVILTAQVAGNAKSQPGGVVTFYCGANVLGTASVVNGLAAITVGNLPVGTDSLTASYGGDARTAASNSTAIAEAITAAPQATTTTLSASAGAVKQGQSFTLTATVAGSTPSGLVTFLNGQTVLGTATVDATGTAQLTTNLAAKGTFALTATYGGDAGNATSVAAAVNIKVSNGSAPATPPAPPATTTTLTASTPSAVRGDPVTLFVRVDRSVAGAVPAGTVSFFNGTTLIGSAALSSGQASLTLTDLAVGADAIRAVYSGDASSATSISPVLEETISLAASSIALASSASSIAQGSAVTLTARVSGNVAPTGTVTFYSGTTALGTANVADGLATRTFTTLPLGTDSITARYSGDGNNAMVASGARTVTVTSAPASSTVSLSASASTVQLGQAVTLSASVRGANPGGTVSFFNGSALLGSAVVQGGSATLSVSQLPLGAANLVAVYSGDAANTSAASGTTAETVTQAGTTTTLTTSTASSVYGSPVVLTAKVGGSGNPGGTVDFYNGTTLLGSATLANGVATLTVNSLPVGSDSLFASYAGNAGNAASQSASVGESVTFAASSVALLSPGSVAPNDAISVSVNGVVPTGTVVFMSGQTVLGTAAVVNGVATLAGTRLPPGSYPLTASYGGDARNAGSTFTFNQTIAAASSSTTLTAVNSYVAENAPLVLTAHVAGSHPGGTVTFYDGSRVLGTASLVNGLAALTVSSLDDGVATLTAVYSGDTSNTGSMSAAVFEQVLAAPVNVSVGSSSVSVKQGAPLTLTATVTGDQVSGTVAFVAGRTTLGSATLVDGVATLSLASVNLPAGTRDIVAVYMGDANNAATVSQAVHQDVTAGIAQLDIASDAQDRTITRIEDSDGLLRATVDAEGYLTEMRYDAAGRLVETVRYANAVSGFVDTTSIAALVAHARSSGSLDALRPATNDADVHGYFYYNARGQKVGEVDGERYLTEYVYDANGNLAQQIRYATPVTGTLPGSLQAVRPASTPQDNVVTNTRDALGRLSRQTNPEGTVTAYTYDEVGRLVRTDVALNTEDQRTLTARYDVQGRVVAELSAEGASLLTGNQTQADIDAIWNAYAIRHTYDAVGRLTSTTDANGNRTVFLYDDAGRLRFTVDALGEVQENRYGVLGRLEQTVSHAATISTADLQGGLVSAQAVSVQSALAALASAAGQSASTFHYDVAGRMVESTDAKGSRTTFGYDAFDELASRTQTVDGQDRVSTTRYDRRGLQVEADASLNGAVLDTESTYDAFGRRTSFRDANHNVYQQSYDRLGRVVQTIDPANASRSASYDAFGRVLTQTDALQHTTTYSYDRAARSITVTSPEGITMTTVHNREGQTTRIVDGDGNTTTYAYDRNGNLTNTDTALTHTRAEYDRANRLVRTVDANQVPVEYEYDAANRLLTRTLDPDGAHPLATHYTYDAKGRQVTVTDPRGIVTQTTYDLNGRVLTQTVDAGPGGLALTTSYEYDEAGDVLTVTSPGGTVTKYVYDALGRRIEEHLAPNGQDLTCRYSYDANGNLLRKTDANGHATLFAYDGDNRLVYTVDATGGVSETRYDAEGRVVGSTAYATPIDVSAHPQSLGVGQVKQLLRPSARDIVQDRVLDKDGRVQYTVDGAGGVTRFWRDGNGNVVRGVSYAQPIARASWTVGSAPAVVADPSDHEVRTLYDALNRVHVVNDGGNVSRFEYDGNGNVLLAVRYATALDVQSWSGALPGAGTQPDETTQAVYDFANRALFQVDGAGGLIAFRYDDDGNVIDRTAFAGKLPAGTSVDAQSLAAAAASLAQPGRDAHIRRIYDHANRLTWSVDGMGAVTQQVFDRNGNIVKQVAYAQTIAANGAPDSVQQDPDDRVTLIAYDAVNQKTWQIDATGAVTQRVYDGVGNMVAFRSYATRLAAPTGGEDAGAGAMALRLTLLEPNVDDRTVRSVFDGANRETYSVDAEGAVTRTSYDGIGQAIREESFAHPLTEAQLPLHARAQDVEAALQADPAADRLTLRAFDGAGRQVLTVDGMGYVSRGDYDGLGRVVSTTLYADSISDGARPPRDLAGDAKAIAALIDADAQHDRTEHRAYDAAGNLASVTDALGHSERYTYDGAGRRIAFTNKSNAQWTYDWDAAGRLATETSPAVALGESQTLTPIVTKYGYDALGNLLARTEAFGIAGQERTTNYGYDALGRQVRTTFPPVAVYDAAADDFVTTDGNVFAQRVETVRVLSSQVTYDAFGDAITNEDVGGNHSYKTYDKLGRVTHDIDALGQVTQYDRNAFGDVRVLTRYASTLSLPGGGATAGQVDAALASLDAAGARQITTFYDHRGQASMVVEPTVWTYAGHGATGQYAPRITVNDYNAFGELESTGVQVDLQHRVTTSNHYDQRGELVRTVDALGYVTTQAYDAAGELTQRTEYARALNDPSSDGLPANDPKDRTSQYTYDLLGRKHTETRLNVEHSDDGRSVSTEPLTTTYDYDALGNLLSTTDAMGGVTTSEYDVLGRVTRVLGPAVQVDNQTVRRETQFLRDAYGNVLLQREVGAAGAAARDTRSQYDSHGHITEVTDSGGYEHFFSYDAHGHVAKEWQFVVGNDGAAHTLYSVFRYDAAGRQTDVITPGSNSAVLRIPIPFVGITIPLLTRVDQAQAGVVHTRVAYNAFGEMVGRGTYQNDAEAADAQLDERFEYDAAGRLVRTNSGDGNWKIFLYDVQGFQTAQITSAGNVDLSPQATSVPDAARLTGGVRRTEATVDALGRVLSQYLPERARAVAPGAYVIDDSIFTGEMFAPVIHQQFDRWGNVISQTDPENGQATTFVYDANNQVVMRVQPGGIGSQVRYDALGRQTATIDGDGNLNRQLWDGAGDLVQEIHADGGTVGYGYNVFGERVKMTDAEQGVTTYRRDDLGRVTQVQMMGEPVTTSTYDSAGRMLTQTNGNGETTAFTYDLRGDVIETKQPMGQLSRAAFDVFGRQTGEVDPDGYLTTWRYDAFGKLTEHEDLGGREHFYKYDLARQLTSDTGGNSLTYGYDEAGQLVAIVDHGTGNVTRYAYDAAGRRTLESTQRTTYTSSAGQPVAHTSVYQRNVLQYDALGRRNDIQALGGYRVHFDYDAAGNKIHEHITGANLARDIETTQQVVVGYDEDGTAQYLTARDSQTVWDASSQDLWFAYDKMNRQTLVDGAQSVGAGPHTGEQLLADTSLINSAQGHILTYDRNGNRTSDTYWGRQLVAQQYYAPDVLPAIYTGGNTEGGSTPPPPWSITTNVPPFAADLPTGTPGNVATIDAGGGTLVIGFDESGNAVTAHLEQRYDWRSGVISEKYSYDAMNRLQTTQLTGNSFDYNLQPVANATTVDVRAYDAAGRLVRQGMDAGAAGAPDAAYRQIVSQDSDWTSRLATTTSTYDPNGRVQSQHSLKPDGSANFDLVYEGAVANAVEVHSHYLIDGELVDYTYTVWQLQDTPGYDEAGNVIGYRYTGSDGVTLNFRREVAPMEGGYKETKIGGFRSDNPTATNYTHDVYDANGNLASLYDDNHTINRSFVNDANGIVLQRTDSGHTAYQLVVGGQLYAEYGAAGDGTSQAAFDPNYQPINQGYPNASVGTYTVRSGDTLQTIAQAAYGDSQLWYLIADANGISSNADLRVGETLNIPAKVGGVHNNSSTFKPYDPSEIIGQTAPALPAPHHDSGCGGLGQIIMVVVAVVVAFYAPELAPELFEAVGGAESAAGMALAAGIGDVASQVVGNAIGAQDGFSWKEVAMAALTAGVTQGVGSYLPNTGSTLGNMVLKRAVGNALSQAIGVTTGLQDHFSWKSVAATAVSTLVGQGLNQAMGYNPRFGFDFGKSLLSGVAGALAGNVVRGGKITAASVAADAFGNVVGDSLAWKNSTLNPSSLNYENALDRQSDAAYEARRTAESIAQSDEIQRRRMGITSNYNGGAAWTADVAARKQAQTPSWLTSSNAASLGKDGQVGQSAPSAGAATPADTNPRDPRYTVSVGKQDTVVDIARREFGDNWRAGVAVIAGMNSLKTNRYGSPLVYGDQDLNVRSLDGLSDSQIAELNRIGGSLVAANSKQMSGVLALEARARIDALMASAGPRGGTGVAYGDAPVSVQAMGAGPAPTAADIEGLGMTSGSIGADQGYVASMGAIANSNLSLGDKLNMAWNTTKFYFRNSDEAQGTAQVIGGGLEVAAATTLTSTGLGTVVAVPLAFHGGDNIGTGFNRILGYRNETFTYQTVEGVTGSPAAASIVDKGIPFIGGVASLASLPRSAWTITNADVNAGMRYEANQAVEQATAWQGSELYPGVDRYRSVVLKPDTYIVGATPGQGNYYTTLSGMQRTGLDVVSYYEGVQVAPNLTNPTYDVVRDGLNIYRVKESTPAAFGRALANTQYGEGGLPQLFISDYSNLQLVKFVPFINKIPGVKP